MPFLIVSQDEPQLSVSKTLSDELLEDAVNGDVEIIQVDSKGNFEKLNPSVGCWNKLDKYEG